MFDALALFVSIVETGSLNAAAEKENIPTATVTRRLQKLEQTLGYQLLTRSARRMEPTAEGWQYFEQCRPLVHAMRQATQRLDATLSAVAGNIRVLAPVNFASGVVNEAWSSFLHTYPDVTLELELSNSTQDLITSGADLAIRFGEMRDSTLMQRRLGRVQMVMAAAPGYLERAGHPENADALASHALIVAEPLRQWRLCHPADKAEIVLQPQAKMRVNEMQLAIAMAIHGHGIIYCPLVQCHDSLENGELVRVMPDWVEAIRPFYAVWSQQRYLPARVRALVEHLADFAARHPFLSDGA